MRFDFGDIVFLSLHDRWRKLEILSSSILYGYCGRSDLV